MMTDRSLGRVTSWWMVLWWKYKWDGACVRRSNARRGKGPVRTSKGVTHDLRVFLVFNGSIACLYLYPEHRPSNRKLRRYFIHIVAIATPELLKLAWSAAFTSSESLGINRSMTGTLGKHVSCSFCQVSFPHLRQCLGQSLMVGKREVIFWS